MKKATNEIKLKLPALSINEGACRAMIAAFCAQVDPNIEELADIKCAVSEAVTNCIVHAYGGRGGIIYITVGIYEGRLIRIEIRDRGCGIADVKEAMQPLFTTDSTGERSGMGFSVMESFMSGLRVHSTVGRGTRVSMWKQLS
ncbi:MAG: anti-sigma F factor [Clostridia bacterium]|nr:anti-sigma F factor [Clostridia bacterium]